MKTCVECKTQLADDVKFCTNCGASQTTIDLCPKCGSALKKTDLFCTECGKEVKKELIKTESENSSSYVNNKVLGNGDKRKSLILIGSIVTLIIVVIAVLFNGVSDTTSKKPAEVAIETYKAEDMLNDYIRDQSSAEQKYKGKKVKVTGHVVRKGQFENSTNLWIDVASNNDGNKSYEIVLDMKPDKVSDYNSLKVYDFIVVEGTCIGIVKQDNPRKVSVQITVDKLVK